jgi:hypothetical protein
MDKCIRTVMIVLALSIGLILATFVTSDSVAQSNATTTDNQSTSTNATGMANLTSVDDQSAGQISGKRH